MGRLLSGAQIAEYEGDGFLVVPDFAPAEACAELKAAAERIVADFRPTPARTMFTTKEQERVSNAEFLSSGGAVWCFYEEDGEHVNKIGHALHDLDPAFERFSYTAELADVAVDIGLADALALQSMYIFKHPFVGGEVGCHQDATFLFTEPLSVTGFWFAIEDATLENGCLWAAPGGHRGPLRKLFRRLGGDDDGTEFITLDETPLPQPGSPRSQAARAHLPSSPPPLRFGGSPRLSPTTRSSDGLVPLEVAAGTLVVLHGLLPHWSDVNTSPISRHAYSLHCISAAADYPPWNWLQRPTSMPLRPLDQSVRR